MTALTIKNIPLNLYRKLRKAATLHRRSINSEVISCLESALNGNKIDPEEFIKDARAWREKNSHIFLTDELLRSARNEGRP
jgi:plasmid stability protein